jgi:hypothetical protein
VKLYLPELPSNQKWISVYTQQPAPVSSYPSWVEVDAPMGKLGVFVAESAFKNDESLKGFLDLMKSMA